jgi:malonyl-CoA O-methyltransferase
MRRSTRRAFERAAATYDAHSVLQREVGRRLLEHLEGIRLEPSLILDLGCATGASFDGLRARFPKARLAGLDIAKPMLDVARHRAPWWRRRFGAAPGLVAGDAERLPFAPGIAQLVFSNLMLQWCKPENVFAEVARVLPPGGLFMFSTFGPDTLKELRGAFAAAGRADRVNAFIDMHDLGDALVHAGFADPVMEMEMITLEYATVTALLHELKRLGSSAQGGQARGLSEKGAWEAVHREYEKLRRGGALPSTYEIVYGHAWKVAPRKLPDGRQVIDFKRRP